MTASTSTSRLAAAAGWRRSQGRSCPATSGRGGCRRTPRPPAAPELSSPARQHDLMAVAARALRRRLNKRRSCRPRSRESSSRADRAATQGPMRPQTSDTQFAPRELERVAIVMACRMQRSVFCSEAPESARGEPRSQWSTRMIGIAANSGSLLSYLADQSHCRPAAGGPRPPVLNPPPPSVGLAPWPLVPGRHDQKPCFSKGPPADPHADGQIVE